VALEQAMSEAGSGPPSQELLAAQEERHAMVDSIFNALLTLNGGGAVALLAFLGAIWADEQGKVLARWGSVGLGLFAVGLVAAVVFQLFRYRASWARGISRYKKVPRFRRIWKVSLKVSVGAFSLAVAIVAVGAFVTIWTGPAATGG
jgi:hypothetical protein